MAIEKAKKELGLISEEDTEKKKASSFKMRKGKERTSPGHLPHNALS